jgi:hypothetical protein
MCSLLQKRKRPLILEAEKRLRQKKAVRITMILLNKKDEKWISLG